MKSEKSPSRPNIELTPSSLERFYRPLPAGFSEPTDELHPQACPFEPTPATPGDPRVAEHQKAVSQNLMLLCTDYAPSQVDPATQRTVIRDYRAGNARRTSENLASFAEWERSADDSNATDQLMAEKIRLGVATPTEILHFMQTTELTSAELGKVTHPYGYRIENVPLLRSEIDGAITACDGRLITPSVDEPYRSLHTQLSISSQGELDGILVTYKRTVGTATCRDGRAISVIERQSAAINYFDSSFDPILRRAIQRYGQTIRQTNHVNIATFKQLGHAIKVGDYIEDAIQSNTDLPFFIPLSTTHYAAAEASPDPQPVVDETIRQRILRLQAEDEAERAKNPDVQMGAIALGSSKRF